MPASHEGLLCPSVGTSGRLVTSRTAEKGEWIDAGARCGYGLPAPRTLLFGPMEDLWVTDTLTYSECVQWQPFHSERRILNHDKDEGQAWVFIAAHVPKT